MSLQSQQPAPNFFSLGMERLRRRRFVIFGAAAVLLLLILTGVITWTQAAWLLVFAIAGAIAPLADDPRVVRARADNDSAAPTSRLIDGIVSGLPDAVIVLDRTGQVVAWNAAAKKIAPSLALGTPLSLALRSADLIVAVR